MSTKEIPGLRNVVALQVLHPPDASFTPEGIDHVAH